MVTRVFGAIKGQLLFALYMYVMFLMLFNSVLSNKKTLYRKYFYGPKVVEASSPVVCYVQCIMYLLLMFLNVCRLSNFACYFVVC